MSKPTKATQQPLHAGVPRDAWLGGYFKNDRVDVRGPQASCDVWRKNIDYLRLKDFALHLLEPGPGKNVLDIGCAGGATMVYCGLQGATVYGQDLDPKGVEEANQNLVRFGIKGEAQCGDAAQLKFENNFFDLAISNDFFEHISDKVKVQVLRETLRVLKPGGRLVIMTPNLNYLKLSRCYKQFKAILRLKNPFRIVIPHTPGTDDPQHIGLTTRRRLSIKLTEAGFLNYQFSYAPFRRFGQGILMEMLSTEVVFIRDILCEDLFCVAYKPISLSHFPN